MCGEFDSCGVWVLSLFYYDGFFWLIYMDVKCYDGYYKDIYNYLVIVLSIEGFWSDVIYFNFSGFDFLFFYDDDGCKWLVNMDWDYCGGYDDYCGFFGGIFL